MSNFFDMGAYGYYVWPCYIVTVIVLVSMLVASLHTLKSQQAKLKVLKEIMNSMEKNR